MMYKVKLADVAIESRESLKTKDSSLPVVGLEHIIPEQINLTKWDVGVDNTFTKLFKKNDVLFGRRRAYLKKAAVAPCDGICSGDITVIRAKPCHSELDSVSQILPDLLPFVIQNDIFFDYAVGKSAGSLSPRVKWEHLANYEFTLPTLAEQKKLAQTLWSIVATMESYKKLLVKTDELVKAKFVEMFGTIDNSKFSTEKWKDVLEVKNGKDTKERPEDGIYPIYGSGGIMGRTNNYTCTENSVIIGRKGTIDKPILVREKYWNVDTAFGLIPKEKLNYMYLYWFCLQYDFIRISKSAVLPSLTKTDLENIDIPMPSIELQNEFADFVQKAEESKSAIQASLDSLTKLYKKIIAENLGGK